jgi:hypothetical protein
MKKQGFARTKAKTPMKRSGARRSVRSPSKPERPPLVEFQNVEDPSFEVILVDASTAPEAAAAAAAAAAAPAPAPAPEQNPDLADSQESKDLARKMYEEVSSLKATVEECKKAIDQLYLITQEGQARGDSPEPLVVADSVEGLRIILERIERRTSEFETGFGKTVRMLASSINAKDEKLTRLHNRVISLEESVAEHVRRTTRQEMQRSPCLTSSDVREIASATAKQVSDMMSKSNRSIEQRIEAVARFMEDVSTSRLGGVSGASHLKR